MYPGEVFTGRVEAVLQAIASGQALVGGSAVAPADIQSAPFVIRIKLDDGDLGATPALRAAPGSRRSSPRTSGRAM